VNQGAPLPPFPPLSSRGARTKMPTTSPARAAAMMKAPSDPPSVAEIAAHGRRRRRHRCSRPARRRRDPPGRAAGEICCGDDRRRLSRDAPRAGASFLRRGSQCRGRDCDAREEGPLRCRVGRGRDDASDATPSTAACTSDGEASRTEAAKREDRGVDGGCRASAGRQRGPRAAERGEAEEDAADGYDTDSAILCDDGGGEALREEDVRRIAAQILREQDIAGDVWDEVAAEYHRRTEPFTSRFVPHLLDPQHLAPSGAAEKGRFLEGLSVLDVAAGTGAGALYAAARGAASVVATDFSEHMLRVLRGRLAAGEAGDNPIFATRCANGLCLPRAWSDAYDVVASNFGVIYFTSVAGGIAEMVRCARPGGRVCASGWGSKEETPAFGVFPKAIKRCGLHRRWRAVRKAARRRPLADTGRQRHGGGGGGASYHCPASRVASSEASLRVLLTRAGLEDVTVTAVEEELRLDDAEAYWERFVKASPNLRRFAERCLRPEEVERLKGTVAEVLREECPRLRDGTGGVALKARAYVAVGTKPTET